MSKRPSLAASRHDVGPKAALGTTVPAAVVSAGEEPEATIVAPRGRVRAPSRSGLRAVTCYVKPEAHKQLRMLGLEKGASVQDLMTEALNDLFRKHGRTLIA